MTPSIRRILIAILAMSAFVLMQTASASAKVESTSDAERPMSQEWASWSCADKSRVRQVEAPAAQGKRAYRLEVRDGDNSYGERCEIGMGNPGRSGFPLFHTGDDRWISWQVYLPDDYPVGTKDWNLFFQIHQQGDGGCPPISMGVEDGQFKLFKSARNTYVLDTREMWAAPAPRNRWVKFTMHIKNSPNPDVGYVELYGDLDGQGMKTLLERTGTHTMTKDPSGGAMVNHARVGTYRNPKIQGTTHILFDGFTIATSKGDAEAASFGDAAAPDAGDQPDPDSGTPEPAAKRHSVWLRSRGRAVRGASSRWGRVMRVYGGVRPKRSADRRTVTIQVRYNHRWQWVARGRVRRNGRFYIAAHLDPKLRGRLKLRAVVAGVGHSRPLVARV